jgi:hypothetical protein
MSWQHRSELGSCGVVVATPQHINRTGLSRNAAFTNSVTFQNSQSVEANGIAAFPSSWPCLRVAVWKELVTEGVLKDEAQHTG